MIEKNLKKLDVKVVKEFEKKRMITESEVTMNAYKGIKIESVIETINQYEDSMAGQVDHKTA